VFPEQDFAQGALLSEVTGALFETGVIGEMGFVHAVGVLETGIRGVWLCFSRHGQAEDF
jgi:hypothetical protein